MGGAQALDWTDLDAWQSATRRRLAPVELRALMRIERAYWTAMNPQKGGDDGV